MINIQCARCGGWFTKNYRLSSKRLSKRNFCSLECFRTSRSDRAGASRSRRFWSHVNKCGENQCWEWQKFRDGNGYGKFQMRHQQPILAHRFAYADHYGRDPGELCVCHECDNPACCNPRHLWLGKQAENVADMMRKGRNRAGAPRRGEKNNTAKLTAEEALHIFNSSESGPALADRFGVTKTAIYLIKRGRNWAHVTGAGHAK